MIRLTLQSLLLLLITVQAAGLSFADEAPLTLLEKPAGQTKQSGAQQQIPQLSQPRQKGSSADEQVAMYDIYGVVPTKTATPYLYIALGVLLIFGLAAVIYWLYKRKKKGVARRVTPPWERALAELKDARSLFGKGEGRDYMARASQILRHYVEERFAIISTRQTTREFLTSLKQAEDAEIKSYKAELQQCLEQADMAKFAHKVQDDESLVVMEQAVTTFVHATRPPAHLEEGK